MNKVNVISEVYMQKSKTLSNFARKWKRKSFSFFGLLPRRFNRFQQLWNEFVKRHTAERTNFRFNWNQKYLVCLSLIPLQFDEKKITGKLQAKYATHDDHNSHNLIQVLNSLTLSRVLCFLFVQVENSTLLFPNLREKFWMCHTKFALNATRSASASRRRLIFLFQLIFH